MKASNMKLSKICGSCLRGLATREIGPATFVIVVAHHGELLLIKLRVEPPSLGSFCVFTFSRIYEAKVMFDDGFTSDFRIEGCQAFSGAIFCKLLLTRQINMKNSLHSGVGRSSKRVVVLPWACEEELHVGVPYALVGAGNEELSSE
jgi:hypothetical protein